jgi:hypothetical protein
MPEDDRLLRVYFLLMFAWLNGNVTMQNIKPDHARPFVVCFRVGWPGYELGRFHFQHGRSTSIYKLLPCRYTAALWTHLQKTENVLRSIAAFSCFVKCICYLRDLEHIYTYLCIANGTHCIDKIVPDCSVVGSVWYPQNTHKKDKQANIHPR